MMAITLEVKDINEANAILGILGKLPYDQVFDLIGRLRAQVIAQIQPPPPPPSPGTDG